MASAARWDCRACWTLDNIVESIAQLEGVVAWAVSEYVVAATGDADLCAGAGSGYLCRLCFWR